MTTTAAPNAAVAPPPPAPIQGEMNGAVAAMPPPPFMGITPPQGGSEGNPMMNSASLYVGDLNPDVNEGVLFDIFNAVGPVASIRVCRDVTTRRSLGYAYVNFHSQADAERALDTMNFTPIKGTPCRMMWSQRDPSLRKTGAGNVFCKNLDPSIDNKALYDTFSLFGDILSCKVVTDREGNSKGYGFIHFESPESANEAIEKINGMLIADREVFVGRFVKRAERPGVSDWTNVFVKNIPLHWNKDRLNDEFSNAGPIASCVVMETSEGKSRGFGFVDFVEHESAVKAVEMMNEKQVLTQLGEETGPEESEGEEESAPPAAPAEAADKEAEEYYVEKKDGTEPAVETKRRKPKKTSLLFVSRAQKKVERERELTAKFEALKIERLNRFAGINCFIKNLAEDIDDELLRKEFSPFGQISSARVMRNEDESSKGFGFVCFTTPEEATRAVTEMNGKLIMGKPIYVALAQRKEARRAQLEAHHGQRMNANPMGRGVLPGQQPMYSNAPMAFYGNQRMMQATQQQFHRMAGGRAGGQGFRQPGLPGQVGLVPPYGSGPIMSPGGQQRAPRRSGQQQRPGALQQQPGRAQRQMPMKFGQSGGMVQPNQAPPLEPLTAANLVNATEEQRKNLIGERLFPLVSMQQPALAGKITGMLLEMDNPELLHLIESPEALLEKIQEAMQVLEGHGEEE